MGAVRQLVRSGPGLTRRTLALLIAAFVLLSTGVLARPPAARADDNSIPWSHPSAVVSGLPDAAQPVFAYTADGTAHALWESERTIYHSTRPTGGGWTAPVRVAAGLSPALALDTEGVLHAVFTNQFLGNYDIFHVTYRDCAWTLPVNVSRTYGVSVSPALAAGPHGSLHAAWMDNSPGYWTIYVGSWDGGFWSSNAVPSARGQSPAIAVSPQGVLFVTWQDRVPSPKMPNGVFDIYSSQRLGTSWTLAVNVSDRPVTDSIGANVITTPDGFAHLTWVDGGRIVRYAFGSGYYWPEPQTVVQAPIAARGARIAAGTGLRLHIAWDEGEIVRISENAGEGWMKPQVMPAAGTLKDVSLAPTRSGGIMVGWVQALPPGSFSIYETRQEAQWPARGWLPVLAH